MRKYIILVTLIVTVLSYSQETNVFVERSYWKTPKSIETIKKDMKNIKNDISALNEHAFDAVTWAILENYPIETLKFLLSQEGNDVNKLTHDRRTYIFWAAYKNNIELMKHLIKHKARLDLKDSHGYTIINFAAATGQQNKAIYQLCLDQGIKMSDQKTTDGKTPLLLLAPFLQDSQMIHYFESEGFSVHDSDNNGNGLIAYAAKGGNKELIQKLITAGVQYKKTGNNAMFFAAKGLRGKTNLLSFYKFLEGLGIQLNVTNSEGKTPLHYLAGRSTNKDIFTYFFAKGVKVNHMDTKGNSLLSLAIRYNTPEMVKFLVEKGAAINVKSNKENTLLGDLFQSFNANKKEIFEEKLEYLLANGLEVTTQQAEGNTLLHLAVDKESTFLVKKAIELKTKINQKNDEGLTPLHLAAMKAREVDVIKVLLANGANKNIRTEFNESAFDLANENEAIKEQQLNFLK